MFSDKNLLTIASHYCIIVQSKLNAGFLIKYKLKKCLSAVSQYEGGLVHANIITESLNQNVVNFTKSILCTFTQLYSLFYIINGNISLPCYISFQNSDNNVLFLITISNSEI